MKRLLFGAMAASALLAARFCEAAVSLAYTDPGWRYELKGDNRTPPTDGAFDGWDGTWSSTNGSAEYDESDLGGVLSTPENAPGGVAAINQGGTTFLRLQDTGDPREAGYPDDGNRKLYFGHDISLDAGVTNPEFIGEAVTLTFRTRLSTAATGIIDGIYTAAGGGERGGTPFGAPWPAGGQGELNHDGGKGMFGIRQLSAEPSVVDGPNGAGVISFSLANAEDLHSDSATPFGKTGLVLNALNGDVPSGAVDAFQIGEGAENFLPIADVTTFHEFWITIKAEVDATLGGTHTVNVYMDGSTTPTRFRITSGTGDDYGGLSYLAAGVGSTGQIAAFDVDFFAYKEGVHVPTAAGGGTFNVADFNHANGVNGADLAIWKTNFGASPATNAMGNADGDTDVDGNDFLIWQRNLGATSAVGSAAAVPEPTAGWLAVCAAFMGWGRARRSRITR